MKNSWLVWIFVLVVIITVWIAFNYQSGVKGKQGVILSDVFPEEETIPVDVEYEFIDNEEKSEPVKIEEEDIGRAIKTDETVEGNLSSSKVIGKDGGNREEGEVEVVNKSDVVVQSGGKFTIQVASFRTKKNAQKVLLEAKKKGYEAYFKARDLGKKGIWYRVYIGRFFTKKDANKFLQRVKRDYPNAFVIAP